MYRSLRLFSTLCVLLLISGCTIQPATMTTASPQDGAMQKALDKWLKEEWAPMTKKEPVINTVKNADGTVVSTKTEIISTAAAATPDGKSANVTSTQVVTTTVTAPDGKVTTSTATTVEADDEASFTLQKYVDKWKVYNENKEKMNAGKPKTPSLLDDLNRMPAVGR